VLSGYAGTRISRATGIGGDTIRAPLAPALQPLAKIYQNYARAAARVAEAELRKHGKAIFEKQYALKRIADILIDLFVGLCVISRANSLIAKDAANAADVERIATVFTHQARRRMIRNIRGATHNEDKAIDDLAQSTIERGEFRWDVI
jgi:acyl-CoA dehydrogenase family protein 9